MIETYLNLQNQVLRHLDEASDQDVTRTLVKDVINQALDARLASQPWPHMLWDTAETFATVANQHVYPLHQEFSRPLYFYNTNTNRYLQELPLRSLPETDFTYTGNTGNAETFAFVGYTPVKAQPTTAGVISIVSSTTADTGSADAVTIRGVVTSTNDVTTETINPNGTTTASGSVSFSKILGVTKASAWDGTLTMTGAGGTTLLTLRAGEYGRQYRQVYIAEAPTAAETISYRFFRRPILLGSDYDVPELPAEVASILIWDSLLLMAGYIDDISAASLVEWRRQQEKLEVAINNLLRDGQSLEAYPRYVRRTDDDYYSDNRRRLWANP